MLSYIQLSKSNLLFNINQFKKILPKNTKICAVIKGNAYGHGQNEIASVIEKYVDYFQVDDIEELKLLRKISNKKTLVFGYVEIKELENLILLDGIPGIFDIEHAIQLNKLGKKLDKKILVHIKIDALLGRQGLLLKDIPTFAKKISKLKYINIDGIYSHFSNIEDAKNLNHAKKQLEYFDKAIGIFEKHGIRDFKKHFCSTAGILVENSLNRKFDIARLGIGMYGLWPSSDLKRKFEKRVYLKPVLRWISHIAQIKEIEKSFPVGYGLTYIPKKRSKIAIVPQGYSDGYDRHLSNNSCVVINNKKCPVIGRVAMNMFAVKIDGLNVKVEDKVVLLGENVSAEYLAEKLNTINYEVVTRISPLLPRIFK